MRTLVPLALALSATAAGQVTQYVGPSPNITSVLDFDNPLVPSGPIATNSPVFTAAGISSVSLFGTGFVVVGDTLTATSNVNGQGLVAQNGVLTVAGPGEALDDIDAMSGFDIVLSAPADEIQVQFTDQINMDYQIELFSGATSLGTGLFGYSGAFPSPPHYWRGTAPFDRAVITFPNMFTIGVGIDDIGFGSGPPPITIPECAETLFASNNGGVVGGAVYFDMTLTQAVSFSGLVTNTGVIAGTPVGLEVYTIPMTYQGNTGSMTGWTLLAADDGTAVSAGDDQETPITFLAPAMLPAGSYGVAIVGNNQTTGLQLDHEYTNGNGTNQSAMSPDGVISLSLGAASNTPFLAPLFTPRVWNGRLCHSAGSPGTNYCGPAVVNSTGASASMGASGTADLAANDLVLEASDLPNNAFAFFLTSQMSAVTPNPGGSTGTLCLGGQIGRYVGMGQIQNAGTTGMVSLAIDNTQHPQPNGFVSIASGETWNFQCWFRDTTPGGAATSNFTDGLEVLFN